MKKLAKVMFGVAAAAAVTASAGQFPFPQNMKYPHGTIIDYADTKVIKDHYDLWKQAWYKADKGWVLAPEGDCSTVSEAIAYGMLITVYMDDQEVFKKLYNTWTSNSAGSNGGMNWRIGCSGGTGTASDADFDAALALVMASKQWNDASYLTAGKSLISWIASNDIASNKIKPGNQWNDGFNPSYATTANFQLFQDVAGGSWSSVISQAYTDLNGCQDSKTGLVPDWCDWNSHKPILTSAAVSNDIGFYDDAARTPWRMAMAYYWYGDTKAQAFNKKVVEWLLPTTRTASGVNSGYKYDGGQYYADESDIRNFVSSTFSGGMGLAAASANEAEPYLETVYKTLKSMTSCAKAQGCGDNVPGEKYYPATLNILYLLLMTGNMPNFYDMTGFEKFTPDPSLGQQLSSSDGVQIEKGDSLVGLSGFWNWGSYHDKLGIGTVMKPDSGSNPLYLIDGEIFANASMEIGPEPEWTQEAADAGLLKYPSAGIAMSFRGDEKGVDFTALGVASVRIKVKTTGTIRFAMLYDASHCAGCEPGILMDPTNDYQTLTFKLKPNGYALGDLTVDQWMTQDPNPAASANDVMKTASGVKFEAKMPKGGTGSVSVKSIEFLDASGNVIDPETIVGYKVPNDFSKYGSSNPGSSNSIGPDQSSSSIFDAIVKADALSTIKVATSGLSVQILNAKLGASYAVMSIQGKVIASGKVTSASHAVMLPNKGMYLVKVGSEIRPVSVK